jgi:Ca2+-dependent lipid-binding protein
VTVIEATDLVAKDANGKSDPFLVLKIDGKVQGKTKVKPKTLSPVWNEVLGASLTKAKKIELTVYDKDLLTNEVCGRTSLRVTSYDQEMDVWLPLKKKGRLHVKYCFKPTWTDEAVRSLTGIFQHSSFVVLYFSILYSSSSSSSSSFPLKFSSL